MNVIKTLRRKFILISTATVIIIVAGVLGLVNTIAHMRVYTQIETYLAYIAQNGESPLPKKYCRTVAGSARRNGRTIHRRLL